MTLRDEVPKSAVVTFQRGLPGLSAREFVILKPDGLDPIVLLQSVDEPDVGLPAIPCHSVVEDYRYELEEQDRAELDLSDGDEPPLLCLAVLILDGGQTGPCCNLAAPILVNPENNRACQVARLESPYSALHPLSGA